MLHCCTSDGSHIRTTAGSHSIFFALRVLSGAKNTFLRIDNCIIVGDGLRSGGGSLKQRWKVQRDCSKRAHNNNERFRVVLTPIM
jgi:hypothetical protein